MPERSHSQTAVWLVSIGIGILFLARGAFQNYIFPMFTDLSALSYAQIASLLNIYVLAQSVCGPLGGWYADRTSVRVALLTSILSGVVSFLLIAASPGFLVSAVAVFIAGMAFVVGKISLNTILVINSTKENLRRSVAKRATLLNLGSFFGNSVAQITSTVGYRFHSIVLGLLYLPLAIGFLAKSPDVGGVPSAKKTWGVEDLKSFSRNRPFLADALRRFAMTLPYGCWGTIIPKYIEDQYGSIKPVWFISLTSVCTTVVGAHFLAVYISAKLYKRGFRWEWWSMTSVILYCIGLLLLLFSSHFAVLISAVAVFICGEVLMTPCFDETVKKHSGEASMSTCIGLLQTVDGLGRWGGAAFALAMYGIMRTSPYSDWYWPIVVGTFFVVSSALHVVAGRLAKSSSERPVVEASLTVIDDPEETVLQSEAPR